MALSLKAATWQIKAVISLVIVAIVVGLFLWWLYGRDEKKELRGTVQQQQQTGRATTAIAERAGEQQAAAAHITIEAERQQLEVIHRYEATRNENPTVRSFGDTPVPPELRQLARDARIARERLGCTETGCPADDAAAPGTGEGDPR